MSHPGAIAQEGLAWPRSAREAAEHPGTYPPAIAA